MSRKPAPSAARPRTSSERVRAAALVMLALAGASLLFSTNRELPPPAATTTTSPLTTALDDDLLAAAQPLLRGEDLESNREHQQQLDAAVKQHAKRQRLREPVAPVAPPRSKTFAELGELSACERERDLALIDVVRASGSKFCATGGRGDSSSTVTLFDAPGGIKSAVITNLELDMSVARIFRPIKDLSQDGGSHDPRFVFHDDLLRCRCAELAARAKSKPNEPLQIWETALALVDAKMDPPATVCDPALAPLAPPKDGEDVVEVDAPVILISRRDDHNPFFQISNALNGWIMARALGWDLAKTRVVHFDAGYPSPVDALHQKLLSPSFELLRGETLLGKRVHFKREVLLSPWEVSGPMMQHLNDDEPCYSSQLFKDFRHVALTTMGAPTEKKLLLVDTLDTNVNDAEDDRVDTIVSSSIVTVTVITRRPYLGRKVQRVWRNEDEILSRMRAEYADLHVVFQSVDFVDLTLQKQMEVVVNSDVVIGMHGAGMVNVMWARPQTLIVEIFPKERHRWGYRNLCQFLDCDWREFRGGEDVGGKPKDANSKDKTIPYSEWRAFFDGPFRDRYAQVQEKENDLAA